MTDPLLIYANKKDLANMIAGFSYTMLGFMATVITILFSFTKSANFEAYKRRKYLSVFFSGYYICILSLVVTAFLSLYGYSSANHVSAHYALLVSFANNLWQIFFLTVIICNIAKNSIENA
jgi:membrane protease YdiL (CAAX protease family)